MKERGESEKEKKQRRERDVVLKWLVKMVR